MNYRHYEIETFEVGRGLWHARFRRADRKPTQIDGIAFDFLNAALGGSNGEEDESLPIYEESLEASVLHRTTGDARPVTQGTDRAVLRTFGDV